MLTKELRTQLEVEEVETANANIPHGGKSSWLRGKQDEAKDCSHCERLACLLAEGRREMPIAEQVECLPSADHC